MIFQWESEEELARRRMKISPAKKLEWLQQMNEFTAKFSSRKTNAVRRELRRTK